MADGFRYPCTGQVSAAGFGAFLEANLGGARRNITLFAQELGAVFKAPCLTLVNSGSSANLVAALALAQELAREGKPLEAIAAAYTFPTTLSALVMAGFRVRLADTEEGGFNLCPLALERMMAQERASLVCVTHFLGFPARMKEIGAIARSRGALILQDACETMDLRDDRLQPVHALGDVTTWSFYHPHHLSSYGGGAVVCANQERWKLCDSIAHWGRACTCHIDSATCAAPAETHRHNFTYLRYGVNVEMSELNACFGRFQFKEWEVAEARRKKNYDILLNAFEGIDAARVYPRDKKNGSPFVFPVTCQGDAAKRAIEEFSRRGVECRSLMGGAMIDQPAFRHLSHDGNKNAEDMSARSFFLGIHQTLKEEDIHAVARIAREVFTKGTGAVRQLGISP